MSHQFYVGQRVVCVDGRASGENGHAGKLCFELVRGQEYIVSAVGEFCWTLPEPISGPAVWLEGFSRPCIWTGRDIPFSANRFRPLESKSISLFRAIAQGVTDGRLIVPDKMPAIEIEAAAWPVDIHIVGTWDLQ